MSDGMAAAPGHFGIDFSNSCRLPRTETVAPTEKKPKLDQENNFYSISVDRYDSDERRRRKEIKRIN